MGALIASRSRALNESRGRKKWPREMSYPTNGAGRAPFILLSRASVQGSGLSSMRATRGDSGLRHETTSAARHR
jgi:hypothetical protein